MKEESENIEQNKDEFKPDRNSFLDEKIDLLENQIHHINTKLHAPDKKSWLSKNFSLILSIVALTTSIAFSIYGIRKEKLKEKAQTEKANELSKSEKIHKIQELTLNLTQLVEKNTKLAAENPNVDVNLLSVMHNYQRLIYINEIMELIEGFTVEFPPDIYALIGINLRNDGQFEKALEFFQRELQSARSTTSRVVAYRDLGQVFGIRNSPVFNADSANYYRRLSILSSDQIYGEQRFLFKGYSYQLWALDEFYLGNPLFAMRLIDSARAQYLNLSENNTAKNHNLRMLGQILSFENRKDLNKVFVNLAGEWVTSRGAATNAKVHFYQNANGWMCSLEVYELDKMVYNLMGTMVSISDSHMTFSLQGMKKIFIYGNPSNDRTSSSASFIVTKSNKNDNVLYVTLNEMNNEGLKFTISKK
ncbi:MAG: hypothetical protein V4651_12460 [Bacteroidota bacterium]